MALEMSYSIALPQNIENSSRLKMLASDYRIMENNFFIVLIVFCIHLNASLFDNALSFLILFHVSNNVLFFT